MSRLLSSDRLLCAFSLSWLALFLSMPAWHSLPAVFCATTGLIGVNSCASFHRLTRKREVLIGLNCLQIVLFGLLNYQLHWAFGAGHYRYEREPRAADWIEFTAAHVLRAADVLNALDEYGLPIQTINHRSMTAGVLLVCMHLTVDVFLIGLVMRWFSRIWRDPPGETRLQRGRRTFGWILMTITLFAGFAASQRMRPSDWVLWPLENVLRLLDVGNMFQIFAWRLHHVEATYWTKGAGLLFRIVAAMWIARLAIWLRLVILRNWGAGIDELTELLDDPEADVRRGAALGLGRTGAAAASAAPALLVATHDINRHVRCAAVWALAQIGSAADAAVPRLLDAIWLDDLNMRLAAADALGRMGCKANAVAGSLVWLWKVSDDATRQAVAMALARIAPHVLHRLRVVETRMATPPPVKAKPWQFSLDAARKLHDKEAEVLSLLMQLINEGFFNKERDTDSIRAALAENGCAAEYTAIFLPLLSLTTDGLLSRRKSNAEYWVHRLA